MKGKKKKDPPESNPFVDGLLDWMDSPDGQLAIEMIDELFETLATVDVDAKARKLIWPDGKRLSIDASVQRIHADYPQFPSDRIEDKVISWLEGG